MRSLPRKKIDWPSYPALAGDVTAPGQKKAKIVVCTASFLTEWTGKERTWGASRGIVPRKGEKEFKAQAFTQYPILAIIFAACSDKWPL